MGLTSARILDGIDVWGMHGAVMRNFTGDSSYPTGGYPLTGTQFGFGNKPLDGVIVVGGNAASAGYRFQYDNVNKKLIIGGSLGAGTTVYAQADIKGSVSADVPIASGALPTNGQLWSTLADAANTTAFTIALQPDIPRNVSISLKNTVAGASTGNAVTFTIVGTFRGAAQTDTISFTALELTSTAQNEVATKHSTKPFDTVTSITPSAAQPASWQHAAGPGSKIGLPQPANPNAESAIISLTKNGADLPKTGLYGTAGTVDFGILADADDVSVEYTTGGEVTNGTSLTAVTVRLLGICRGT